MGAYISDAALTDSMTQSSSLDLTSLPTVGRSINTISPKLSWAWLVIPTVAVSPSTSTHSCSFVYFFSAILASFFIILFNKGNIIYYNFLKISSNFNVKFIHPVSNVINITHTNRFFKYR